MNKEILANLGRTLGKDLTINSVFKTVLNMSIPMTWGMLSVIAFNVADTYFIGQLGTVELAAMSLTFPVVMIFFSLALGTATAVSSVVARALGESNFDRVKRYTSDGLTFGLIIVIISVVIGLNSIDPVFKLLGATEKTLPLVREYMEIWFSGIAFLTIPMAGNGALRAVGEMKIASTIMFVAALSNIVLDAVLIFGWGPIPAMGIKGAALATVMARAITMVASFYYLHFRFKMLDFSIPPLKEALESWKKILFIAIPTAGTNLLAPLAMAFATGIVARLGEAEIAAYGVVNRLESFGLIYIYALSAALAPIIGQNFGARKFERLWLAMNSSYLLSFIWCSIIATVFYLFSSELVSLFDDNSQVVRVGSDYLIIVPLTLVFLAIRFMATSFYNAIGKPSMAVYLGVINLLVLFIPLVYFGANGYGMRGVIYAHALTNLLIGIISWIIVTLHLKSKKLES